MLKPKCTSQYVEFYKAGSEAPSMGAKQSCPYLHVTKLHKVVWIIFQNDEVVVRCNFVYLPPLVLWKWYTGGVAGIGVHIQNLHEEKIKMEKWHDHLIIHKVNLVMYTLKCSRKYLILQHNSKYIASVAYYI